MQLEFDQYVAQAPISHSSCPMHWWAHQPSYPILSSVAQTMLCVPSTSIFSKVADLSRAGAVKSRHCHFSDGQSVTVVSLFGRYRPLSHRIPPPTPAGTVRRHRRRKKFGAPPRQPKFTEAADALLLYIEFLCVLLIMISSIIIIAHAVQPSIDKHPGKVSHQTNMGRLKMQDQKMEDQKR